MTYTLFVDNYEVHQRRENALAIFGHGKTCEVTQLKNHNMRKNCISHSMKHINMLINICIKKFYISAAANLLLYSITDF